MSEGAAAFVKAITSAQRKVVLALCAAGGRVVLGTRSPGRLAGRTQRSAGFSVPRWGTGAAPRQESIPFASTCLLLIDFSTTVMVFIALKIHIYISSLKIVLKVTHR